MYQNRLRELNRQALIGMIIGAAFVVIYTCYAFSVLEDVTFMIKDVFYLLLLIVLFAWLFMGVPYVWKVLGEKMSFSQAGTLVFLLVILFLRVVITIGFSWIIFPVVYLYTFIQAKKEENALTSKVHEKE